MGLPFVWQQTRNALHVFLPIASTLCRLEVSIDKIACLSKWFAEFFKLNLCNIKKVRSKLPREKTPDQNKIVFCRTKCVAQQVISGLSARTARPLIKTKLTGSKCMCTQCMLDPERILKEKMVSNISFARAKHPQQKRYKKCFTLMH